MTARKPPRTTRILVPRRFDRPKICVRMLYISRALRVLFSRLRRRVLFQTTRRRVQLYRDQINIRMSPMTRGATPRLFNLDLHIAVIADLEEEFVSQGAQVTRWSISNHNHLVPGRLPVSDPVQFINQKTWRNLNIDVIARFQDRYHDFLAHFDGFICTHTPAFAELFGVFEKPILVMATTRYEAPYTDRRGDWCRLNEFLTRGVQSGQIVLVANNSGDASYLSHFTDLAVPVVPSLCNKPTCERASNSKRLVMSADPRLTRLVELQTHKRYQVPSLPGRTYAWETLAQSSEVLVFPQNVSTMTLFELATAGVPVAVPSRRWIRELRDSGYQVLHQCTFSEIYGLPTAHLSEDDPTNYESPRYLDWWLDRADFHNEALMPNVRVVDSISELVGAPPVDRAAIDHSARSVLVAERNREIRSLRRHLVQDFLRLV